MDATKSFPNPLTVAGAESSVGAGVSWHKNAHVQFITHYNDRCSYVDSARIALEGGCRWVQLRMKDAEESLLMETYELNSHSLLFESYHPPIIKVHLCSGLDNFSDDFIIS